MTTNRRKFLNQGTLVAGAIAAQGAVRNASALHAIGESQIMVRAGSIE